MEAAFAWLSDIVRGLLKFLPRLVIVRSTHAGVVFWTIPFFGCIVRAWHPGLHLYWPLISECEIVPVKRQTTRCAGQTLTTADSVCVKLRFVLIYDVHDAVAYLTECWDGEDTVQDHCLRAVAAKVGVTQFADLVSGEANKKLATELRRDLKRFGVNVLEATFSDMVETVVVSGMEFPESVILHQS